MKKLWIVPLGLVAAALAWLVVATAERAIQATLQTLAERLPRGEGRLGLAQKLKGHRRRRTGRAYDPVLRRDGMR